MDATEAMVTFNRVLELFVGLAHALLGREAERFLFKNPFAFLDALLEVALLEQDLGTDQHAGNIAGIRLETGLYAGKGVIDIARHVLVIRKPCEGHRLDLLLADSLFQGIQSNSHLSLQGKQNSFVRQKDRNPIADDIGSGARLVHEGLGQRFRNFLTGGVLERTGSNSLVQEGKEGIIRHSESPPSFRAAKNIQKFIIEHKAFIINHL